MKGIDFEVNLQVVHNYVLSTAFFQNIPTTQYMLLHLIHFTEIYNPYNSCTEMCRSQLL